MWTRGPSIQTDKMQKGAAMEQTGPSLDAQRPPDGPAEWPVEVVAAAADAAEALTRLAERDDRLSLGLALRLTRHVLACVPPRPRVFADLEAEQGWDDAAWSASAALDLVERALAADGPPPSLDELARARAGTEAMADRIAAAADDYDYDSGCRAVAVVIALLDVVAGRAPLAQVGWAAARAMPCANEPRSPSSPDGTVMQAADQQLMAHRGSALLPVLAAWLGPAAPGGGGPA